MAMDQVDAYLARVRSAAVLALLGVLAFTLPLRRLRDIAAAAVLLARSRCRLCRNLPGHGARRRGARRHGLWLPALLAVATSGQLGSASTTWLLLPLCAPVGAALAVPAVSAVAVYLIGTTVGVIFRTPWPWVLGAWTAPLAYAAASRWLVDFACLA